MTISILNDCLLLRKKAPEAIREYFERINVKVFDAIFSKLDPLEASQTVLFIVCAYSEDSPLQVLRQDNKEEKIGVCDFLDIPDFMRQNLFNLKDAEVRKAVIAYLNQFAGPLYKSWQFLRIQLVDLENDVINRAFTAPKSQKEEKEEGEEEEGSAPAQVVMYWDIKEHFKAVAQHTILSKQVASIEELIKSKVKKMEGIEELNNFADKAKKSGKMSGGRRGNVEGYVRK